MVTQTNAHTRSPSVPIMLGCGWGYCGATRYHWKLSTLQREQPGVAAAAEGAAAAVAVGVVMAAAVAVGVVMTVVMTVAGGNGEGGGEGGDGGGAGRGFGMRERATVAAVRW